MRRHWVISLLILTALPQQLRLPPSSAQERPRVRVAVTSPGMTNISLYIADRRGFFKEQQIFNETIVMRSAARQIQALVAGSIDFSAPGPAPLVCGVGRG